MPPEMKTHIKRTGLSECHCLCVCVCVWLCVYVYSDLREGVCVCVGCYMMKDSMKYDIVRPYSSLYYLPISVYEPPGHEQKGEVG